MPVVVPEHAAPERLRLQPHLGTARTEADPVPQDLLAAQAGIYRGATSHDPFGFIGFGEWAAWQRQETVEETPAKVA